MSVKRSPIIPCCILALSLTILLSLPSRAQGFRPVSEEELKMTSELQAPGAPAVILFREVDRDDYGLPSREENYVRIKVLTEEGRKYGNLNLEFDRAYANIVNIHARTIKPDGSIREFKEQVLERTVVKARGLSYLAKTLTLPDVQVGSILEYYYTVTLVGNLLYRSHWIVDDELFTRKAKFTLKPYQSENRQMSLRRSWQGLPPGLQPIQGMDRLFTLEVEDVPAFQVEDFMPPPIELRGRVDFIYEDRYFERDPDAYWRHVGKDWNEGLEAFLGSPKAMEKAVSEMISPNDPPETKLRRIYGRVQKLRNTSLETQKTVQEQKRDKEKPVKTVEDVWKHGYGTGVQLTWLYLALLRAAGFEAYGVWVSSRRDYFFNPKTMESRRLNANVVLVKMNGKDVYLDPGAAFTPFGMLTWSETGTPGLCLNREGGTWIKTTLPRSSESRVQRTATLMLTDTGTLQGKVTVTFTGLAAMYNRLEVHGADDVARRKFLEDLIKGEIPGAPEAELTNKPEWDNPELPLIAEFNLKVPDWSLSAGKRTVVPTAIFSATERYVFDSPHRTHPVYFRYPYEKDDDVTVELPSGWQVSSVPTPQTRSGPNLAYSLKVENGRTKLAVSRTLSVDEFLLEAASYPQLRDFFQAVRTA